MKLHLVVQLVLAFVSAGAFADTPVKSNAPTMNSIDEMYTYEQINQVADYLGTKVENPKTKLLSCDVSEDKATSWLSGPIRELIDLKRPNEIKTFKQDPKKYNSKVKGCSNRCSCNGFSLMVSDMETDRESANYKDFDALLNAETKKLTKEKSLSCAKKLNWFCKSKLRSYLRQQ